MCYKPDRVDSVIKPASNIESIKATEKRPSAEESKRKWRLCSKQKYLIVCSLFQVWSKIRLKTKKKIASFCQNRSKAASFENVCWKRLQRRSNEFFHRETDSGADRKPGLSTSLRRVGRRPRKLVRLLWSLNSVGSNSSFSSCSSLSEHFRAEYFLVAQGVRVLPLLGVSEAWAHVAGRPVVARCNPSRSSQTRVVGAASFRRRDRDVSESEINTDSFFKKSVFVDSLFEQCLFTFNSHRQPSLGKGFVQVFWHFTLLQNLLSKTKNIKKTRITSRENTCCLQVLTLSGWAKSGYETSLAELVESYSS